VSVSPVGELNALSILQPRKILMTTAAIDAFRALVSSRAKPAAGGAKTGRSKVAAGKAGAKVAKAAKTKSSGSGVGVGVGVAKGGRK
jgi:hypothetical protein